MDAPLLTATIASIGDSEVNMRRLVHKRCRCKKASTLSDELPRFTTKWTGTP